MEIIKTNEIPKPKEYCHLRKICGLSVLSEEAASIGLPNSVHSVTLRLEEKLIGMGRIVGDGGCHMQIVDIAVHPDFQKRGLSRIILSDLKEYLDNKIPSCAIVSLFADVDYLYQKFGFAYPAKSKGMFYYGNKK